MKLLNDLVAYFKASYEEMKKVTWPTKKQTINYSLLVIFMSVGFAVFFSLLDYTFNWGFTELFIK